MLGVNLKHLEARKAKVGSGEAKLLKVGRAVEAQARVLAGKGTIKRAKEGQAIALGAGVTRGIAKPCLQNHDNENRMRNRRVAQVQVVRPPDQKVLQYGNHHFHNSCH